MGMPSGYGCLKKEAAVLSKKRKGILIGVGILVSLCVLFVVWLIACQNSRLEIKVVDPEGRPVVGIAVKAQFPRTIGGPDIVLFQDLETTNEEGIVVWKQPAIGTVPITVGSQEAAEFEDEAIGVSYEAHIRGFLGIALTRKIELTYPPE